MGFFCLLANQGVRIINTSSDRFIKRDLSGEVPSKKSSDFGGRKSFTFKARTWQVIIIRNGEGIVAGASCQFSAEKESCFLHDNVPWELYSLASFLALPPRPPSRVPSIKSGPTGIRRAAEIRPIKSFEDSSFMLLRDARPEIGNPKDREGIRFRQRDRK